MGEMELREKYGGKLAKAINRAIRAEIPGGNPALDKLTQLAGPALHSGWYDAKGIPTAEAAEYFRHKHEVVDKMEARVRGKWDIPIPRRKPEKRTNRKRGTGAGGNGRKSR
ncbi:MAG TPA: hypothetical protein VGG44_04905 [Tepidisphaeraceae bacterium]|jgi:hypothetical protein